MKTFLSLKAVLIIQPCKASRRFLRARCFFEFLNVFKSITLLIHLSSFQILKSSKVMPCFSRSISHFGRRPKPDHCCSGLLGFRYRGDWLSLTFIAPGTFISASETPSSIRSCNQAGRFPYPVQVLNGFSGSRYTGTPLGRFSDCKGTSIGFFPSSSFFLDMI